MLTWQEEIQTEEDLAVLKHIDKETQKQLHDYSLIMNSDEVEQGSIFLRFFNSDLIYEITQHETNPLQQKGTKK